MSIRDCIIRHRGDGTVDAERTQEAVDLLTELEREHGGRMSVADADATAGRRAVAELEREAMRRRRNVLKQARIQQDNLRRMIGYRTVSGQENPGRAALSVLARDMTEQSSAPNVETRYKTVLNQAHAISADFLEKFRVKAGGLIRAHAGLENVVKERFGEPTGDVTAAAAARAFGNGAEYLRLRRNAAGGGTPKREDWGLPQKHDSIAVSEVPRDEWINFFINDLDRSQIIDDLTGQPMSEFRLRDELVKAYERIRTNGLSDIAPGTGRNRRAVANRRMEHRFLIWKDADSWLKYQRRFGSPDIFETMLHHFDSMAMDIARMEVLGPNPDAGLQFLIDSVRKQTAGKGRKALETGEAAIDALRRVNLEQTGAQVIPVKSSIAQGFQALRNVLTSAQLGAAQLSAITDLNFQRMARRFNGLGSVTADLPTIFKLMNPLNVEDQKLAVRAAMGAENWSSMALAQHRYTGDVVGPRWSRVLSDVLLRVSGLSPWTQAGRWSFGIEFLGHLTDLRGQRLADLPAPTQRALRRVGIGEGDWLRVGQAPTMTERGATLLDLVKFDKTDRDIVNKLQQLIIQETEFAVPTTSVRTRAQLRFGQRPGSFPGEMLASVAMYKSFPVSVIHLHIMRGLNLDKLSDRGIYLANLIVGTTLMGALAWQMKEVARGRDPQNMSDPKFWEAAMIQGGGLGIFGDFLFSDVNRFGGSPILTAAGPVAGFIDDSVRLTLGNIRQFAKDERHNFLGETVRFAKRYTPFSSLWYSRLAMERLVWDELERMADPRAGRRWLRIEREILRERGQRFYAPPGGRSVRPPELGRAFGVE